MIFRFQLLRRDRRRQHRDHEITRAIVKALTRGFLLGIIVHRFLLQLVICLSTGRRWKPIKPSNHRSGNGLHESSARRIAAPVLFLAAIICRARTSQHRPNRHGPPRAGGGVLPTLPIPNSSIEFRIPRSSRCERCPVAPHDICHRSYTVFRMQTGIRSHCARLLFNAASARIRAARQAIHERHHGSNGGPACSRFKSRLP